MAMGVVFVCRARALAMLLLCTQAFKRPDSDLAAKKLAQSLLSKILACFVAKLEALAQVGRGWKRQLPHAWQQLWL